MSSYLDYKLEDSVEFVNYFDELPLWSAPFGLLLLKHLNVRKNITIVDIGSGTGFPLLELASRFGSSCTVYGIDCWSNANERARQKTAYHKLENVVIKNESAEKMLFENGSIDMVVSNLGLNNFDSVENVFREVYRILKPGGSFTITSNSFGHWKEMYELLYQCCTELRNHSALKILQKEEAHRMAVHDIVQLFASNDFHVNKQVTEIFEMSFADGSAFLNHHFVKLGWVASWFKLLIGYDFPAIYKSFEQALNKKAAESGFLTFTTPCTLFEGIKLQ